MDCDNLPASLISLRNVTLSSEKNSLSFKSVPDFVWKLRQDASACRSLLVDADVPASVAHAPETILDFTIHAFQIEVPHKRNFDKKIPNCESATGSGGSF